MKLELTGNEKSVVLNDTEKYLSQCALDVDAKDFDRPWGGFFVIDENEAEKFGKLFFPDVDVNSLRISGKLSPKILVVAPGKRLSWQYHHRRAEIWRVIYGTVGVKTSSTDEEGMLKEISFGESITLSQGERHRLIGLNDWGIVAEIWQHTDAGNPSDEDDIIRLQDDFGR